jgi:hypothetical protein
MNPVTAEPTAQKPVLLLPTVTPELEVLAQEVLYGLAEAAKTSPAPILVTGPAHNLVSIGRSPLVILGWTADHEESRRRAGEALASVALRGSPAYVAKFQLSSTPTCACSPRWSRSRSAWDRTASRTVAESSNGPAAGAHECTPSGAPRWNSRCRPNRKRILPTPSPRAPFRGAGRWSDDG